MVKYIGNFCIIKVIYLYNTSYIYDYFKLELKYVMYMDITQNSAGGYKCFVKNVVCKLNKYITIIKM